MQFQGWELAVLSLGFRFRIQGFGFRIQGVGFRIQGFGIRIQGFGFRIQGFGCTLEFGFRFWASQISRFEPAYATETKNESTQSLGNPGREKCTNGSLPYSTKPYFFVGSYYNP